MTLPEAVRDRTSKRVRLGYWAQAELVAIATDLAEVVGGAIALYLLFAIGLLASGLASTSVGAYAGAMIMQGLLRRKIPLLVRLTSDRSLIGAQTNHRVTTLLAWLIAAVIIVLNVVLIYLTFFG